MFTLNLSFILHRVLCTSSFTLVGPAENCVGVIQKIRLVIELLVSANVCDGLSTCGPCEECPSEIQ